jgi:uncharacterized Tic20 family protein
MSDIQVEDNGDNPVSPKERRIAAICHLSGFIGFLIPPIGHLLGPLLVWLIYRDKSLFIDDQGREAVNFQLSTTFYVIASSLLVFIFVGMFLMVILSVFWLVFVVVATVRSSQGSLFRYPLNLRIL